MADFSHGDEGKMKFHKDTRFQPQAVFCVLWHLATGEEGCPESCTRVGKGGLPSPFNYEITWYSHLQENLFLITIGEPSVVMVIRFRSQQVDGNKANKSNSPQLFPSEKQTCKSYLWCFLVWMKEGHFQGFLLIAFMVYQRKMYKERAQHSSLL